MRTLLTRTAVFLITAFCCSAQLLQAQHVEAFVGGYNKGPGNGHPYVDVAVGARAGVNTGPHVGFDAEFLHVPTTLNAGPNAGVHDLFALRGLFRLDILPGDVRPFAYVGAGWQSWRTWVGNDQTSTHGMTGIGGVGVAIKATGPLWVRLDARHEGAFWHSSAPIQRAWMFTLGLGVGG